MWPPWPWLYCSARMMPVVSRMAVVSREVISPVRRTPTPTRTGAAGAVTRTLTPPPTRSLWRRRCLRWSTQPTEMASPPAPLQCCASAFQTASAPGGRSRCSVACWNSQFDSAIMASRVAASSYLTASQSAWGPAACVTWRTARYMTPTRSPFSTSIGTAEAPTMARMRFCRTLKS